MSVWTFHIPLAPKANDTFPEAFGYRGGPGGRHGSGRHGGQDRKGIPLPPHPEGRHGGAEPREPAMLSGITKALTSTRPSSLAQPSLVPHASALSCAASIHGTLPHACPPLLSSLACGASSDCLILERARPNTNLYHSVGSTRSIAECCLFTKVPYVAGWCTPTWAAAVCAIDPEGMLAHI